MKVRQNVSDLQGQHYLDDLRRASGGDRSFKTGMLVLGANHNYFNTEWSPGAVSDGGDAITGYQVSTDDGATWSALAGDHVVTGLTDGTTYAVRVRAVNSVGTGPASDPAVAI